MAILFYPWRRMAASKRIGGSARAAGADLVLAAAAIRQLATRDARCSRDALMQLIEGALRSPIPMLRLSG